MARILIIRKHKTNNMKRYYILAFYILLVAGTATAQEETISLTLQQAIEIAQEHSPQAQAAHLSCSLLELPLLPCKLFAVRYVEFIPQP